MHSEIRGIRFLRGKLYRRHIGSRITHRTPSMVMIPPSWGESMWALCATANLGQYALFGILPECYLRPLVWGEVGEGCALPSIYGNLGDPYT